jgi:aspartate-semialdehyde dehydrogenase
VKKYAVAVVGATGLVGRKMLQVLEEHRFPVGEIRLLASARSAGRTVTFARKHEPVHVLTPGSFAGVDIALFSAGATVSREYAPHAVSAGTLVVDNSSAFRLDAGVPLVVPEVNRADIFRHRGIIANPNCSTIQMVVALKPLHDLWKIRRIVVSTYQSVTGAGKKGLTQLEDEIAQRPAGEKKFPHRIAFNVLPQVDVFLEDGSSKEEYKMAEETKKIMGDDTIRVSATCVRVPVWGGHSESVNVEFEKPCDVAAARAALGAAAGVIVRDDPERSEYPMPVDAWDTDPVYVGRIRRDPTVPSGLNLWIVADNLRKGAATNAVQIAEEWVKGQ